MLAYEFEQSVPANHRVEIELPADAPVGNARVIVLFPENPNITAPATPTGRPFATLAEFNAWLMTQPPSGRTAEEIDRQIQEERDSWE